MKKVKMEIERQDMLFALCLGMAVIFLLTRIRLGLADIDESFFLTVPYRLVQGDSLFTDEWHASQLSGLLLYPIMKLYLALKGNTEGIYLSFRYMYLILQTGVTIIGYCLLRKRDKKAALMASLIFFLYAPNNVRVLSYNTMGLMTVWLWVTTSLYQGPSLRTRNIILGIILAANVLCNPYMILAYVLYAAVCIWKRKGDLFSIKAFVEVTLGAGIIFVIFCVFVFSRVSLSDILKNIPYIIATDPAHDPSRRVFRYFESIIWFLDWFKPYFIAFFLGSAAAVYFRRWRRWIYSGLVLMSVAFEVVLVVFKTGGIGRYAHMLPLAMLGMVAFLLAKKKPWDLLVRGWIVGMIYALCMNLSSDQGIYAICWACTIPSAVSVFLIKDYFEEEQTEWKWCWWCMAVLIVGQLCAQLYSDWNYHFWEEGNSTLTSVIEEGPMRGIVTTEKKKEIYDVNYSNIKSLGDLEGKNLLIFNYMPSGYLIAEKARNAGFSSWMTTYTALDAEGIVQYYELNPEKIPDIIYVDTQADCEWTDKEWDEWCEENGYIREKLASGGASLRREN